MKRNFLFILGAVLSFSTVFALKQHSTSTETVTPTTPIITLKNYPIQNTVSVKSENLVVSPTPTGFKDNRPLLSNKKFTRLAIDPERTLTLLEEVNEASVTKVISSILLLQEKSQDPITLLINSPGGSVLDGSSLLTVMENSKVKVNTVCLQMCASMAFVIFQYGATRFTLDRAILMAHQASGSATGKVEGMLSMLNVLKRLVDKTDAYIAKRSGIPYDQWKAEVASDVWIDGQDAVERNLADKLVVLDLPNTFPTLQVTSQTFEFLKDIKEFK